MKTPPQRKRAATTMKIILVRIVSHPVQATAGVSALAPKRHDYPLDAN
jgi:hypothetical protein